MKKGTGGKSHYSSVLQYCLMLYNYFKTVPSGYKYCMLVTRGFKKEGDPWCLPRNNTIDNAVACYWV